MLRDQYIGCRFVSLGLDSTSDSENVTLVTVAYIIEQGFESADDDCPQEFQYVQRNKILRVPRIFKDEQRNDMVAGPLRPIWGELPQKYRDENENTENPAAIPLNSRSGGLSGLRVGL